MSFLDIEVPLRWTDLDGYQHVNNVAFLRLLEEARISAFWEPTAHEKDLGASTYPTATAMLAPGGEFQTFVSSHRIEYLQPLPYRREGVIVRLWISKIGAASLDVDYEILAKDQLDLPYARARTVIVLVDALTGRPRRVSAELTAQLAEFADEPLAFRG